MKTKHLNRLYYLLTENIRTDIPIEQSKKNSLECLEIVSNYRQEKQEKQYKRRYTSK